MLGVRVKFERAPTPVWNDLPRYGRKFLIAAVFLSLFVHIISFLGAGHYGSWDSPPAVSNEKVKIRVSDPAKPNNKETDDFAKKIIETPQVETAPPVESEHVGPQDHVAEKETKLARKELVDNRGLDAGNIGRQQTKPKPQSEPVAKEIISGPGTLAFAGSDTKPRNNYEKLIPSKERDVFGTPTAGYAEYIDAQIPEGDRIDMNTTSFRYISYFTGMRKAIELVWIYPGEAARRGLQGEVILQLVIEKNGKVSKVRVVNSSGYPILDDNMVQTIKLASPFAPFPKSWKKERLLVTGSFHYILSNGAH